MAANSTTVILAHGAWADGSSWGKVILPLEQRGLRVIAAPIPLTSLTDDITALGRAINRTSGPMTLAAHAYAGGVISAVKHGARASWDGRDRNRKTICAITVGRGVQLEGIDMRYLVIAAVMAVGLGVFGIGGASAAPANGKVISDGAQHASNITKVWGGCDRGWHRNRWGRCVP
jgi:hypothetical protein